MRLAAVIQTLEKLQNSNDPWNEDDVIQVRNCLTKTLQYIRSQDKANRDFLAKNCNNSLNILLRTPKLSEDEKMTKLTIDILLDLISTSGSSRLVALVQQGVTQTVFTYVVRFENRNGFLEILFSCFTIITKLAVRDKKVATKARLTGALQVLINLVRERSTYYRSIIPVVHVLKLCSASALNSSYMGKENILVTLMKIVNGCGQKYTMLLKFTLETISILVKNKNNAARLVGGDALPTLLNLYVFWQKYENTKPRFNAIRKGLLRIFKRVAMLKQARCILNSCGALEILSDIYETSDSNGILLSLILRRLIPRIKVCSYPVQRYNLPENNDEDDPEAETPLYNISLNWNDVKNYSVFFPELTDFECFADISGPGPNTNTSDDDFEVSTSAFSTAKYDFRVDPEDYSRISKYVKSVDEFNKLAYPDMYGHLRSNDENLLNRKESAFKRRILSDVKRVFDEELINKLIFNVEELTTSSPSSNGELGNDDVKCILSDRNNCLGSTELEFNSRFESGNLKKVIKIRDFEYDLFLNSDVNTNSHHQWFYFEVRNMSAKTTYTFNLVNCEKLNSQFNFGMQPVLFSVKESLREGKSVWKRCGTNIFYYKNHYEYQIGSDSRNYFTASFQIEFPYDNDVCYLAYHYPYTYTYLRTNLEYWRERSCKNDNIYFKINKLCETLGGNDCPVVTITAPPRTKDSAGLEEFLSRPYIFLSGRVHPGETNASWVMHGLIDYLLSDVAQPVRESYIFKIVPMLNPDGVINGNYRCGLGGEDLNRHWINPTNLQPTIKATKSLIHYLVAVNKKPLVYCDLHGHSRRKNVFLFGCNPKESWINPDVFNPALKDQGWKTLPNLLDYYSPAFSISNCAFTVERPKEGSARVAVWRQFGIVRSYTMESTYCGFDQGSMKNRQVNTSHLAFMGRIFVECLLKLQDKEKFASSPLDPEEEHNAPPNGLDDLDDREDSDLLSEEDYDDDFLIEVEDDDDNDDDVYLK